MNKIEVEVSDAWMTFARLIVDIGITSAVYYEQLQGTLDEPTIEKDIPEMASELREAWLRIQIAESKLRELQ
jgi:hypothetical protein